MKAYGTPWSDLSCPKCGSFELERTIQYIDDELVHRCDNCGWMGTNPKLTERPSENKVDRLTKG